jgi:hypothetical protein
VPQSQPGVGAPGGWRVAPLYMGIGDDVAESNEADNMGWGQLTVGN